MSAQGFYYELANTRDGWNPRWSKEKPEVKNGRIHTVGSGPGSLIRCLQPLMKHTQKPTLDQMRETYSPDGRFSSTGYCKNQKAGLVEHDVEIKERPNV